MRVIMCGLTAIGVVTACAHGVDLAPDGFGRGDAGSSGAGAGFPEAAVGGGANQAGAGGSGSLGAGMLTTGAAGISAGGAPADGGGAGSTRAAGNAGASGKGGGNAGSGGIADSGRVDARNVGGAGGMSGNSGGAGESTDGGPGICDAQSIPPRGGWVAIAAFNSNLAPLAVNANLTSRYTTGKVQAGDEWLQVDFGATATLDSVTLFTSSPNDYPVHWQMRVSSASLDLAAPVALEGDGDGANTVIQLPVPVSGRYLLVSQTGVSLTNWWSVHDLSVLCQ